MLAKKGYYTALGHELGQECLFLCRELDTARGQVIE